VFASDPIIRKIAAAEECVWFSPHLRPAEEALAAIPYTRADVEDAARRLARFAPYIQRCFPETAADGGLIESPLTEIPRMAAFLRETQVPCLPGRVFLKRDSDLAVAGSVKARGGIYEVLKHAETLALAAGLLRETDDYAKLAEPECKDFFRQYEVAVGSTGNLGLSIGIMSAALGFRVTVHMSADARQWKKDLLRSKGVCVMEYAGDYSEAVRQGRALSDADPMSYFVDDENSVDLFMGYAVAALRLQGQLAAAGIAVDAAHPLFVTIPCGVGGAPGGVTFGLKLLYGDNVHIFYAEPVQCPCMLLGLATGLNSEICVQDAGLTGKTHADGLAVGRPSGFVGGVVRTLIAGEYTLADYRLYDLMRALLDTENIFIEPSACACLPAPAMLAAAPGMADACGELQSLYDALEAVDAADTLRLDFSTLNDIDYYNGVVFKGYVRGVPRAVLAGGRYDNLMRRFGKPQPAVGFALYLGGLGRAFAEKSDYDVDTLLLYDAGQSPAQVARAVQSILKSGRSVRAEQSAPEGLRVRQTLRLGPDGAVPVTGGGGIC